MEELRAQKIALTVIGVGRGGGLYMEAYLVKYSMRVALRHLAMVFVAAILLGYGYYRFDAVSFLFILIGVFVVFNTGRGAYLVVKNGGLLRIDREGVSFFFSILNPSVHFLSFEEIECVNILERRTPFRRTYLELICNDKSFIISNSLYSSITLRRVFSVLKKFSKDNS